MIQRPSKQLLSLLGALIILCLIMAVNAIGQRNIKREQFCTTMRTSITRGFYDSVGGKIEGRAASVYDFTNERQVYSFNDTLPLPLASLTKLMTVRVAMQTLTPERTYTVIPEDTVFDGPTGFVAGDTYSVKDLLKATLIASSNNAANMLARMTRPIEEEFIASMNAEAKKLGLASLQYKSVSGLDTENLNPTANGSARDVLKLLYKDTVDMPDVMILGTMPGTTIRATNGRSIELENTNDYVEKLGLLKASKTGYTVTAGGNLAVLWQEPHGNTIGAAVLGSTISGRFTDILTLHDAANLYTEAMRAMPAYCSH